MKTVSNDRRAALMFDYEVCRPPLAFFIDRPEQPFTASIRFDVQDDAGLYTLTVSGEDKALMPSGESPRMVFNDETGAPRPIPLARFFDHDDAVLVGRELAAFYRRDWRRTLKTPTGNAGTLANPTYADLDAALAALSPAARECLNICAMVFGLARSGKRGPTAFGVFVPDRAGKAPAAVALRPGVTASLASLAAMGTGLPPDMIAEIEARFRQ